MWPPVKMRVATQQFPQMLFPRSAQIVLLESSDQEGTEQSTCRGSEVKVVHEFGSCPNRLAVSGSGGCLYETPAVQQHLPPRPSNQEQETPETDVCRHDKRNHG